MSDKTNSAPRKMSGTVTQPGTTSTKHSYTLKPQLNNPVNANLLEYRHSVTYGGH
jgi:hypothetical protein